MDRSLRILLADDDADDRLLVRDALSESRISNELFVVEDGVQLLDFLRRHHGYAAPASSPRPDLILLDLNMPKMDGRQCLTEIKSDPDLRSIPVVVLTTSQSDEEIRRSYHLGANSFLTKPVTFEGLVAQMRSLGRYWKDTVKLPE